MKLTPEIDQELRNRLRSRSLRADDVRRARLILMLSDGKSFATIQKALGCNRSYITRWKARFLQQGLGRTLRASSRAKSSQAHSEIGSSNLVVDSKTAGGWLDALE